MTLRLNLGLRVRSAQDQTSDGKGDRMLFYKAWAHSPYNSPPLICAWPPGMNQGQPDQHQRLLRETSHQSLNGQDGH